MGWPGFFTFLLPDPAVQAVRAIAGCYLCQGNTVVNESFNRACDPFPVIELELIRDGDKETGGGDPEKNAGYR
jgi:hypothetical protein